MSRFTIEQIGHDLEPTAGIPDGCDICGHCTVLREVFGAQAATPCRGGVIRGPGAQDAPVLALLISKDAFVNQKL